MEDSMFQNLLPANFEYNPNLCSQTWKVIKKAVPKTTTALLFQAPLVIDLVYAGHFDDQTKLAGLALGHALLNAMLLAVLIAVNAAHETLIRKALEEGDYKSSGQMKNRARLMLTVFYVPLAFLVYVVGAHMVPLFTNQEVAIQAQNVMHVNIIGQFFAAHFDLTKRFMNTADYVVLPAIAQMVAASLHIIWCYLFVNRLFVGDLTGLAIADTITYFIMYMLVTVFSCCVPAETEEISVLDRSIVENWSDFLKFAFTKTACYLTQVWAWAALVVCAGGFGIENQAAMYIILTLITLSFAISVGIRHATYGLVRDTLKEGNVPLAKEYAYIAFSVGLSLMLSLSGTLFILKSEVVDLFTQDVKISEIAEEVIPLVCLTNIFDLTVACVIGYLSAVDPENYDFIESLTEFVRAPSMHGKYVALKVFAFYLVFGGSAIVYTLTLQFEDMGLWLSYELAIFFLFFASIISMYTELGAKMANFSVQKFQEDQFEGGEYEPLLNEDLEFAKLITDDKSGSYNNALDQTEFARKSILTKLNQRDSPEDAHYLLLKSYPPPPRPEADIQESTFMKKEEVKWETPFQREATPFPMEQRQDSSVMVSKKSTNKVAKPAPVVDREPANEKEATPEKAESTVVVQRTSPRPVAEFVPTAAPAQQVIIVKETVIVREIIKETIIKERVVKEKVKKEKKEKKVKKMKKSSSSGSEPRVYEIVSKPDSPKQKPTEEIKIEDDSPMDVVKAVQSPTWFNNPTLAAADGKIYAEPKDQTLMSVPVLSNGAEANYSDFSSTVTKIPQVQTVEFVSAEKEPEIEEPVLETEEPLSLIQEPVTETEEKALDVEAQAVLTEEPVSETQIAEPVAEVEETVPIAEGFANGAVEPVTMTLEEEPEMEVAEAELVPVEEMPTQFMNPTLAAVAESMGTQPQPQTLMSVPVLSNGAEANYSDFSSTVTKIPQDQSVEIVSAEKEPEIEEPVLETEEPLPLIQEPVTETEEKMPEVEMMPLLTEEPVSKIQIVEPVVEEEEEVKKPMTEGLANKTAEPVTMSLQTEPDMEVAEAELALEVQLLRIQELVSETEISEPVSLTTELEPQNEGPETELAPVEEEKVPEDEEKVLEVTEPHAEMEDEVPNADVQMPQIQEPVSEIEIEEPLSVTTELEPQTEEPETELVPVEEEKVPETEEKVQEITEHQAEMEDEVPNAEVQMPQIEEPVSEIDIEEPLPVTTELEPQNEGPETELAPVEEEKMPEDEEKVLEIKEPHAEMEDEVPNADVQMPEIQEPVSEIEIGEPLSVTNELEPQNEGPETELALVEEEKVPEDEENVSVIQEPVTESEEMAPKIEEPVPQIQEPVSETEIDEPASLTTDQEPKTEGPETELAPVDEEKVPEDEEKVLEVTEPQAEMEDEVPNADVQMPQIEEPVSEIEIGEPLPVTNELEPQTEEPETELVPVAAEAVPETEENVPMIQEPVTETEEKMLEVEVQALMAEEPVTESHIVEPATEVEENEPIVEGLPNQITEPVAMTTEAEPYIEGPETELAPVEEVKVPVNAALIDISLEPILETEDNVLDTEEQQPEIQVPVEEQKMMPVRSMEDPWKIFLTSNETQNDMDDDLDFQTPSQQMQEHQMKQSFRSRGKPASEPQSSEMTDMSIDDDDMDIDMDSKVMMPYAEQAERKLSHKKIVNRIDDYEESKHQVVYIDDMGAHNESDVRPSEEEETQFYVMKQMYGRIRGLSVKK